MTSNAARSILPVIRPYLRVKHRQADLLAEYLRIAKTHGQIANYSEQVEHVYRRLRDLNRRGRNDPVK